MGAGEKRTFAALLLALAALYAGAVFVLHPFSRIPDDAPSYLEAIEVVGGADTPEGFMPNRILTTPLTLLSVRALAPLAGGYLPAWAALNSAFFFGLGIVSYLWLRRLFGADAALFGALLIAANYDVLVFGIAYLTDIGGWFFYLLALYFLAGYARSGARRDILFASLAAGVGGLFKEYALVAAIPIGAMLLFDHGRRPLALIRESFLPALLAAGPLLLVHGWVFAAYHFTYLDWYRFNDRAYGYHAWLPNAIKSFGAVLNLLAVPAAFGAYVSARAARLDRRTIFLASLLVPACVIFLWPSITERVVFLAVPAAAAFACAAFERSGRLLWLWAPPLLLAYAAISLTLDSHILPAVNLPF